jgi:hypothetical protein
MSETTFVCPGCGHDAHTPGYCVMDGCGNCEVGQPRCGHCDTPVSLGERLCAACRKRDLLDRLDFELRIRRQS